MFLTALLMTTVIDGYSPTTEPIHCTFPGADAAQRPIEITLDPRPSLKDQPGLWRVMMEMNGKMSLRASAQPIPGTTERDVLIRGVTQKKSTYIIGLRDDGSAALNMATRVAGQADPRKELREGQCSGFEQHINRWLPS